MKKAGLVSDLAVSNFSPAQLDVVLALGGTKPVVNQLPLSVTNQLPGVLEANRERGVFVDLTPGAQLSFFGSSLFLFCP